MIIHRQLDREHIADWDSETMNLIVADTLMRKNIVLSPAAQIELVRLLEEIVETDLRNQKI